MPRLSVQKGKGKWREPAMKVWNHLAWQDLGEFGATLACVALLGRFPATTTKRADTPNVRNTAALVDRNVEWTGCGCKVSAISVVLRSGCCLPLCRYYWSAKCIYGYAHSLYQLAQVVTTVIWRARRRVCQGEGVSNLWERFVGDRAALSCEFSRNSGEGVSVAPNRNKP